MRCHMQYSDQLRQALVSVSVNADFTEAVLGLNQGNNLLFCHRIGERWVRAATAAETNGEPAKHIVAAIVRFRLNRKHLDVEFADGSRWEARF